MLRACALLAVWATVFAAPADARRVRKNDLLRVVTPAERATVPAHPFVNVIVRFGQTTSGLAADPTSFRARVGRFDVTPQFEDIVEDGAVVGKRAALEQPLIREGRAQNRLRLEIRSVAPKTKSGRPGRRLRDVDRVRFRAAAANDNPPVARISVGSDIVLPGIPVQFSADQSSDPDDDEITAHWTFSDGTESDDWSPSHVFNDSSSDVFVMLTVTDQELGSVETRTLLATPPICDGCTPGKMRIVGGGALEFAAVAPGANKTLTFTVQNNDATPTSQLHARLATDSGAFTASPADFVLGPSATQDVNVVFAPTAPGHQSANLTLVSSSSNRPAIHLLAHGYGGTAPGTGPTFAPDVAFYADISGVTSGILPDGTRFFADNGVHACLGANGLGTLDLCTSDQDCVTPGETCAQSSTCIGGDRKDQVCSTAADCPGGGFCRSYSTADPVDMCGDGTGGLYVITDIGTFTDPAPDPSTELSTTLVHLQFDPATGTRTAADVIARATDQTAQIACDGFAPTNGGQVYVPQFFNVDVPATSCSRDEREALTAFPKNGGNGGNILPDIDAVGGYAECDDFDPTSDLEVTRDATSIYASLPLTGLSRLRPTPLLISPDIVDFFQIHPDGSILYVTTSDAGGTGTIRLYKIAPEQAIHGAPHLSDLTPCATYQVPNNCVHVPKPGTTDPVTPCPVDHIDSQTRGQTLLGTSSFAADRTAPGSQDGIVLVSFVTTGGFPDIPAEMLLRGTLAIASPANSNACTVLGLVNLELLDPLTF